MREIHEIPRGVHHGRVRCAIKLAPTELGPEWCKTEWGWDPSKNWIAYEITDVLLLSKHCTLKQSYEGRPWKLQFDDLLEASSLVAAIACGVPVKEKPKISRKTFGNPQEHRKMEKKLKRELKKQRIQAIKHYEFSTPDKPNFSYQCCKSNCMLNYKCAVDDQEGVPLIQFLRNNFFDFSRETKREFISHRCTDKNDDLGVKTKHLYLESIETLQYYVEQGTLPLRPSCAPVQMHKVCHNFFKWVLHISNNKIAQPTILDSDGFSVAMSGSSVRHISDFGASDCVRKWLTNYAQAHLHDPAKDRRIILSVPSRKLVYELFEQDFKDKFFFYFPHKHDEYYLPSKSYFFRCWRRDPVLKNIVIRKYLRFALCDECVHYRELRRTASTEAERNEIKKKERIHHNFVHEERSTYYMRRNQGIFEKQHYLSLIIDGADQAAYGLPHWIEKDKFSSKYQKMPVYLMGALVHGVGTYGFTYLKNIKHGTNIVIECLHRILVDIYKKQQFIPSVIFLQLDNTWKQNKNKYILGFLALLVAWSVCRTVILSFLPVGHTHEDIGQFIAFVFVFFVSFIYLFVWIFTKFVSRSIIFKDRPISQFA